MKNQITFERQEATKTTTKKKFFAEIENQLPIKEWLEIIAPIYDKKTTNGRPRKDLEIMLRAHIFKLCYSLSDEACEDELQENITVRNFCGITEDMEIPDHTSLWRFEEFLAENKLQEKMFKKQVDRLIVGGFIIKRGTLVDSSIIHTPTNKRNKEKATHKDDSWTKKGGNYHHGEKAHIGADADSGLVHSCTMTTAKAHDLDGVEDCLHGEEDYMMGDSAYLNAENHSEKARNCKRHIMKRRTSVKNMPPHKQESRRRIEQKIASVRAKVEHKFGIIKGLFGWKYTRKSGLDRNKDKLCMLCAMANIYALTRPNRRCIA